MVNRAAPGTGQRGVQRPPRAVAFLLLIFVAAAGVGCVTVAEHRKLERRVMDLQRAEGGEQSRQQLADLAAELDTLRSELRDLTGRLEEVERLANESMEEARKARREVAAVAVGRSGSGDGASADPGDSAVAGAVARAGEDAALSEELAAYQAGVAAWRAKDYPACIDRFGAFLQTYASSSRADDAAFWIADCHYKQGEFKNAVLRFDDVVRNYPTGNRAPDALYRQGESLLKLGPGFQEAARRAFERVLKEYPDSARAAEAKKRLEAYAG